MNDRPRRLFQAHSQSTLDERDARARKIRTAIAVWQIEHNRHFRFPDVAQRLKEHGVELSRTSFHTLRTEGAYLVVGGEKLYRILEDYLDTPPDALVHPLQPWPAAYEERIDAALRAAPRKISWGLASDLWDSTTPGRLERLQRFLEDDMRAHPRD